MRRATWAFVLFSFLPTTVAVAQQTGQQKDSLAAAARRAREEKKQQGQSPKVWNNDNIPRSPGSLSIIGEAPAEAAGTADDESKKAETNPAAAGPDAKKAPAAAGQKAALEADLAAAKEQLQTLQNDFDILQRKHTLDQQMYYGKPDYSSDKAAAAALQDEQDQIDAKQQEMIAAQQKVAGLQAKLNAGTSDTKNNPQQQ